MGGDKIVLLDGAGANGGGAATNGLLSMEDLKKLIVERLK